MGGFISKAKAVPVENKREPEELEKPFSDGERKGNEIQNLEGSGKITEDPIADEAGGDVMDDLVGQAGKMSIEEEIVPRPATPTVVETDLVIEKEVHTTCTEEAKDDQLETVVDQPKDAVEVSKENETIEAPVAQEAPLVNDDGIQDAQDIEEGAKDDLIEEVPEKVEDVEAQVGRPVTPSLDEITAFDKSSLKPTETAEKTALPTVGDIAQEKLPQEIDVFDKAVLRQVETEEKVILPTLPQMAQEKTLEEITSFDKSNLQPVPTTEPTQEEEIVADDKISKDIAMDDGVLIENTEH